MGELPWILLFITLLVAAVVIILSLKSNNDTLSKEINYYRGTYLRHQGGTIGIPNYEIRSFDGGKKWYAVESSGNGVVILGLAETVYPGLLDRIAGLEELINFVQKNGPITIGSTTSAQMAMLNRAGIELVRN